MIPRWHDASEEVWNYASGEMKEDDYTPICYGMICICYGMMPLTSYGMMFLRNI